jgi:hypothetical protein
MNAFLTFFDKIDGLKKHDITRKTFYNTIYEYPLNFIKLDASKKLYKNWLKYKTLVTVKYDARRIPPEISMKYFGKIVHQTTNLDIIIIDQEFYGVPDYIYMDAQYLSEYLNDILSKYELRLSYNEIPLDKILDFIKDLDIDDFEFFLNTKKYNL